MDYAAVLFDLDGTLVHTSPVYRYFVIGKTLQELGVSSLGMKQAIDRFWFEVAKPEIIQQEFHLDPKKFWEKFRKNEHAQLRKDCTRVYGDTDFLTELRKKGYKTGIVTGAPEDVAALEIALLGESQVDQTVLALTSNGIKRKPHPEGLEVCLAKLGVRPQQAIYVGNSNEDIFAARNAGMLDVLIARGEYEFPDLAPTVTINTLYELRKLLEK